MENLLHIGLSNAIAAAVLALLAAAAGIVLRRRPALMHALWLLILIKLFTPPLVRLPAPWLSEPTPVTTTEQPQAPPTMPKANGEENAVMLMAPLQFDQADGHVDAQPMRFVLRMDSALVSESSTWADAAVAAPVVRPAPVATSADGSPSWLYTVAGVWAAGSAAWFLLAAFRIGRFKRLLRHATAAPTRLNDRVRRLAARLGLKKCPVVLLVPGRLSPMLWAAGGKPRLLVPAGLLDNVRDDQLDTLLLHELAHLRRRDHWVRALEVLAMGLYWWHPAVWWARRELRENEEQCCDAWVVSVLAGSRRTYAEALVETLDFLSTSTRVPLLASGIGHVSDLKRRLTMILNGTTPRALTWRGGLAMIALTALLPLVPAWVRAEPPQAVEKESSVRQDHQPNAAVDDARNKEEIEKLRAELQLRKAELKVLEAKVKNAAERLGKAKGGKGSVVVPDQPKPKTTIEKSAVFDLVPGEKGELILRPAPKGAVTRIIVSSDDAWKDVYRLMEHQALELRNQSKALRDRTPGDDKRLEQIEKRINDLIDALEKVKRELQTRPPLRSHNDETRANLENALLSLEMELYTKEQTHGANHPDIIALKEKINTVKKFISDIPVEPEKP